MTEPRSVRLVAAINTQDIPHRRGWKPSDYDGKPITIEHLRDEVNELHGALDDLQFSFLNKSHKSILKAHAKEELADVFACVLQTAYRLGMTFEDLDREAERKLRLRFVGADAVNIDSPNA